MKRYAFLCALLICTSTIQAHEMDLAQEYITLAQTHHQKGDTEKATHYYQQAIRLAPNNLEFQFIVGNFYANTLHYEKAVEAYRFILDKYPSIPSVLYNYAYCLNALGHVHEASEYYYKVITAHPEHGNAHQGYADTQLKLGKFPQAWSHFEYRWTKPRPDSAKFAAAVQAGTKLHNKTVLLRCEFGYGDSFHFVRYAQMVKSLGAHIIVEAQKPLVAVLALCPYIDQVIPADSPTPAHDFACTLMSLPWAFNTTLETIPHAIPYLFADQKLMKVWQEKLASDTNFKIGICWNGNVYNEKTLQNIVHAKSLPLSLLAPVSQLPGVSLYSLQKTSGMEQLKKLPADFRIKSFDIDFDESHGRFMDSAALIMQLDLVITIDTSIAHLAGGLGKPVWLMLPHVADWRWFLDRTDSPWYPTMQLFRQPKNGDWQSVVDQVVAALPAHIQQHISRAQKNTQPTRQHIYGDTAQKTQDVTQTRTTQAETARGIHSGQQAELKKLVEQFNTSFKKNDYKECLPLLTHLITLMPRNPTIYAFLGKTLKELHLYKDAIYAYEKALNLNPTLLSALSGLGECYCTLSDLDNGWKYWRTWHSLRDQPSHKTMPMWRGESLHGKKILIDDEGGYGDLFQWIRYASICKEQGATVIVNARKSAHPILSSCRDIDQLVQQGAPLPQYDMYIPIDRIHYTCNTTMQTIPAKIPYLFADKKLVEACKSKLSNDKNFKIGICWATQTYIDNDTGEKILNRRSAPLKTIASLGNLENISLYSLQQHDGLSELEAVRTQHKIHTFDDSFDKAHGKFMDTAAAIETLDLIVTIDTSIAHLAGALGRPVWVMLPYTADWRWFINRTDSPWYPTMRLFRQSQPGDWESVVNDIATELKKLMLQKAVGQKEAAPQPQQPIQQPILSPQDLFQHGVDAFNKGNLQVALTHFTQALQYHPQEAAIIYNIAGTQRRLNNLPQAIEYYSKALTLLPQSGDVAFGLAQAYLASGQIEDGWKYFNNWRQDVLKKCPSLTEISGKTIIIRDEWGLGDVFHFIRYASLLKAMGATVIVEARSALKPLLSLCPFISQVVTKGNTFPPADYNIPLLCLPTLFKTKASTIPAQVPYLYADTKLVDQWQTTLKDDNAFKIGICWDIGHHDTNILAWQRTAPLESWLPLAHIPGISLYSLQQNGNETIASLKNKLAITTFGKDFDITNGAFMDTAAVMKNLDLILTVDTSIAHLAGALGIPVWVMLPYSPDYRWTLQGSTTPWYPTMRLFRQPTPGDWASVVQEVTKALNIITTTKIGAPTSTDTKKSIAWAASAPFGKPITSADMVTQLYNSSGKK